MRLYEVVEIISAKTKRFGMKAFNSDKEMAEYLRGRMEWNEGNKQYSIVAWTLVAPEAYIDLSRHGYEETVI